jgi:hypothetical protein
MQLWKEIYEQLSEDDEPLRGFSYTVWAGRGGYFAEIRNILSFRSNEIELIAAGKEKVKITGKNLCVKKYCERDVLLGGDIFTVERTKERGE